MFSLPVYVGLDYHDSVVQVCVLDRNGTVLANRPCSNKLREIVNVVGLRGSGVFAAIEACNGSASLAEKLIERAGWSVDVAHPGYVARIKQSPDKTDFSDARLLADLERVGYLPKVWLASHEVRELRRVVRYRQQLAAERRNLKLRIGASLREQRLRRAGRPWTKPWLEWLKTTAALSASGRWVVDRQLTRFEQVENELKQVERQLDTMTANDPLVQKLLSMAGIGLITAVTIRAEIGRFDRFRTGKQLARFCGLTPRNASSGQRQADAGLIKAGNPQLRAVLIEAAHRLMMHDPHWESLGKQLRARGKPYNVVIAAVGNRWIRWLYHQVKPAPAMTDLTVASAGGSATSDAAAPQDFSRHDSGVQQPKRNSPRRSASTGARGAVGAPESGISLVRLRPRRA